MFAKQYEGRIRLNSRRNYICYLIICYCSVAQLCLTVCGPMTTAPQPPCPSPSPWVCSNSCPLSQGCHPAVSSSVVPFSSWLQSFPASGSFPVSWLFTSSGHSIGTSASVLPVNIQDWFPLGLTGFISLQSKGLSRAFSSTIIQKHSPFFMVQLSHPYKTTRKTIALTIQTFVGKSYVFAF